MGVSATSEQSVSKKLIESARKAILRPDTLAPSDIRKLAYYITARYGDASILHKPGDRVEHIDGGNGVIVGCHDAHGAYWDVKFEDGEEIPCDISVIKPPYAD